MSDAAASAISPRFASASAAPAETSRSSPERAAEISAKRDAVVSRAEAHFEKHRQLWTNRQYGVLLARDGERMDYRPNGMGDDRKSHLMRAADYLVRQRQANRLARVERAAVNMQRGGNREVRNGLER
ncbi:hypothetical protein [Novosphingobium sp. CECT 9465]|uniref:hypothetical protein n=1 Tax=Novosphingobium sp. CECT 9465 TaxID=2829794 RepID=UPI001E2FAB35|nr:hypothetical protein [Novosphingobium sp. CECT 9465]CAH0496076.1 hypothetical protein NVSP9465_01104 [Novosphingobium sp. CECT 9465]